MKCFSVIILQRAPSSYFISTGSSVSCRQACLSGRIIFLVMPGLLEPKIKIFDLFYNSVVALGAKIWHKHYEPNSMDLHRQSFQETWDKFSVFIMQQLISSPENCFFKSNTFSDLYYPHHTNCNTENKPW